MVASRRSTNISTKFSWVQKLRVYLNPVKKRGTVFLSLNIDSFLYPNKVRTKSQITPSYLNRGHLLSLGVNPAAQPIAKGVRGDEGVKLKINDLSAHISPKPRKLRDSFVRMLLYRFLLNLWGTDVTLCFFRNLQRTLSLEEVAFIKLRQHRIFLLAPAGLRTLKQRERYPWANGFLAIYLAIRYRDPALLLHWLQNRIRVMSMFAHLRFFRTLGLILKTTVLGAFGKYKLKGFSFCLVGKISVSGNAMSRTYRAFAGKRGNSNLSLRLSSGFNIIRTPTGCLGFTLSFFF